MYPCRLSSFVKFQLWCDVVPIDTYHILLSRPCNMIGTFCMMVIIKLIHFSRHGKKITLISQSSSFSITSHPCLGNFHSMIKILHYEHHKIIEFRDMIICSHGDESPSYNHDYPTFLPLVEKFVRVFPQEISPGLLPKRDMQHRRDLVPSSSLPNRGIEFLGTGRPGSK